MFKIEDHIKSNDRVSSLISKLKKEPAIKHLKEEIDSIKPNKVNLTERVISAVVSIDILLAIKQIDETPLKKYGITLEDVKTKIIRSITTAYIKVVLNSLITLNKEESNQLIAELNEGDQKSFCALISYFYTSFTDFIIEKEPGFIAKDIDSDTDEHQAKTNTKKNKPSSYIKTPSPLKNQNKENILTKSYKNEELLDVLVEFEDRLSLVYLFVLIDIASNGNYEDESDNIRIISRALSSLEILLVIFGKSDNKEIEFETHSVLEIRKLFKNSLSDDVIKKIIKSSERLIEYINDDMNKHIDSHIDYVTITTQIQNLIGKLK